MEKEKNISFFKKFIISIKDLDKYNQLGAEKISRGIIYLTELVLIFSLIFSLIVAYKGNTLINQASNYITNEIPEFKEEDNKFHIDSEKTEEMENDEYLKIKIIMTNDELDDTYKDKISNYDGNMIVFSKEKVVMKYASGMEQEESYDEFKEMYSINDFSNAGIIDKLNNQNMQEVLSEVFIIVFLTALISSIINALALSILAIIVIKLARININYKSALNMSIYALTLPNILFLIFASLWVLIGFSMPYLQMMYTIISYIYVVAAILIIKSEQNKRKQEIITTIQIGKKEEEIKKEENKEQEKKPDENKEKEEKEKKDENNGNSKEKKKNNKAKNNPNPEPQANIEEKL